MHELQGKILKIAQASNLGKLTLRQIAEMVGERSPQKIKHHLQQLEKRGLIRVDKINGVIEKTEAGEIPGLLTNAQLLSIPIVGAANAGPARLIGEQNIEGYLKISSTLLGRNSHHHLFALKVDGPSMNRAEVGGKRMQDGDYVIVDADLRVPRDGDVVLSIIDGMANIKRFRHDQLNRQIVLFSDSSYDLPPIHIHETDEFLINGTIVQVIKKPK